MLNIVEHNGVKCLTGLVLWFNVAILMGENAVLIHLNVIIIMRDGAINLSQSVCGWESLEY